MSLSPPQHLRLILVVSAATLVLLVALAASALYPADVRANRAEYEELVRLTLGCCAGGDYLGTVSDNPYVSSVTGRRAELMRALGVDEVHYYPGNSAHPGAVVYLARNVFGPVQGLVAYSVDGGAKRGMTSCYTSRSIGGKWYRGHSLGCVFG